VEDEMKKMSLPRTCRLKGFLLLLVIVGIWQPNLVWGQAAQRVPLELKVELDDGKIKIGATFVDALKKRINCTDKFVLAAAEIPRIILRIDAEKIVDLPYQSAILVIWTVATPGPRAPREIFQDYILMVGVSEAYADKFAEDILNYTQNNILSKFTAIRGKKN
jgi:hypothetical protein